MGDTTITVIESIAGLQPFAAAWDRLAADALEPNAFYERWFLEPHLRACAAGRTLALVLVARSDRSLIGLFPFERVRRYRGLPTVALRLWEHGYCPLSTPLIHAQHAAECLTALYDWFAGSSAAAVLELMNVAGDGPVHHALIDLANERDLSIQSGSLKTRGFFLPAESADAYLARALRSDGRRKLRGKERKLGELGAISCDELALDGDVARWTGEFLELERSGWKGQAGTAMGSQEADSGFFQTVASAAFERGSLMMLALRLGGRAIAMKCSFQAGAGSFAFKIAYDETCAAHSPGMLLEVENIRRLHARPDIAWMDSCANPRSRVFRELWTARRTVETLIVAPKDGSLALALLPLARWARKKAQVVRGAK